MAKSTEAMAGHLPLVEAQVDVTVKRPLHR